MGELTLPTFQDFDTTFKGETLDGWTTDPLPIYNNKLVGENTKLIQPVCSEISSYHETVPFPPCPNRFCAQNDPYQGYWNYVIRDTLRNESDDSLDINFFYYKSYGSQISDENECTLHISATDMNLSCQNEAVRMDMNRTTNALYNGLKHYQDTATQTHECRVKD